MSWRVVARTETRLVLRDRPWLAWALGVLLAATGCAALLLFAEAGSLRLERDRAGAVSGTLVRKGLLGRTVVAFPPGSIRGTDREGSDARIEHLSPPCLGVTTVETHAFRRVVLRTADAPVPFLRRFREGDGPAEDQGRIDRFLSSGSPGSVLVERDERGSILAFSLLLILPAGLLLGRRALTVDADRERGTVALRWRGCSWFSRRALPIEEVRSVWVVVGAPGASWLALETTAGAPVFLRRFGVGPRRAQEEAGDLLRGFLHPATARRTAAPELLRPGAW